MSPLPERRKSAEELAALRETLGISAEGPPPGAPGVAKGGALEEEVKTGIVEELKSAVFEAPAEVAPAAEVKAKTVRSLRKSERLPRERPRQTFSKMADGKLPVRRHTENELVRLKHAEAPAVVPPVVHLERITAGGTTLLFLYGVGMLLVSLGWAGRWARGLPSMDLPDWLAEAVALPYYGMILYGLLAGGAAVMLLGAGWIHLRRPRSRHHAGFLTIIAVLVLVFGTLYSFPALHGA